MRFELEKSIEMLERAPTTIEALLDGLSNEWVSGNEGENTWNPYDVVGHLIHAEKTNWIPRMEVILSGNADKTFPAFDRFAQLAVSQEKSIHDLIQEFKTIRKKSLEVLRSKPLTLQNLSKTGIHPQLGEVSLQQLLATWTVHDLTHIAQIVRVLAKQLKEEVGPWIVNLRVLRQ